MLSTILAFALMTDRDEAMERLRAERELAIQRLREYRLTGLYPGGFTDEANVPPDDPHYDEFVPRIHVFVAPNGALCAVAHLIAASGRGDLVDRVAAEQNGLCAGATEDEEVLEWILNSGLTREEVIRIQRPAEEEPITTDIAIAAHLEQVELELIENTEASLEIMVDRLLASAR